MEAKTQRIGNEIFQECPIRDWDTMLMAWREDHTKPCPMPVGHRMFDHPEEYRICLSTMPTPRR